MVACTLAGSMDSIRVMCVIFGAAVAAQDVEISSCDDTRDVVDDLSVSGNKSRDTVSYLLGQED